MYDPTIGRWLSEDPIGFQAADANLYRYVGNSPTNATDPTGLAEEPPFPTTTGEVSAAVENPKEWYLKQFADYWTIGTRPGILKSTTSVQFLDTAMLPKQPTGPGTAVANGYQKFIGPLKPGQFAGTSGCSPCLGVIVHTPKKGTAVFHINANDAAIGTVNKYKWDAGSKIVVFGGNNESIALAQLSQLIFYFEQNYPKEYMGVADVENLWVDSDGEFRTTKR